MPRKLENYFIGHSTQVSGVKGYNPLETWVRMECPVGEGGGGGWGTPHNGLYGEAPPERGTLLYT